MSIFSEHLKALIDQELSTVRDARVRSHVRELQIEPLEVVREWDYGHPGEAYKCWTVLRERNSNVEIAYCLDGFGPKNPWGLVATSGPHMSMGMDCGWFSTFLEAYFDSAASELPIWQVFQQASGSSYPGSPLSDELTWESAWSEVMRLRASDGSCRYHVEQLLHSLIR